MSHSSPLTIKTLAESAAVVVAIGFIVSIIYDWGFVRALGLDFACLPTVTADHFRSGLLWFPPLLGVVLAYMAIEFQFQRVERGLTEQEIVESSSNPAAMRNLRQGPWKLVAWTAPVYIVAYVFIGDAFASLLPLMSSIAWMGFAEWCYAAPLIKQRRNKNLQLGFTFLPIVGILAYFNGYNAGVDAVVRKPIEVTVERLDPLTAVSGKNLRMIEKGVLLLNTNNSIQFIPWNQVVSIVNKKVYTPFRGVLSGEEDKGVEAIPTTHNLKIKSPAGN